MKQLTNRLTDEQLSQLIKKAIEEGRDEARYYLTIKEYKGKDGEAKILQVYGDFEMILMDIDDVDSDTREFTYAILPKNEVVVLILEETIKNNSQKSVHVFAYVFVYPAGWKSLTIN